MTPWVTLREWWQWFYSELIVFVYFHRVGGVAPAAVPKGPVLFVGTHRNGLLDGMVYAHVLGRLTPVVARRLQKGFLGRLLFGGIGLVREKDGQSRADLRANREALRQCQDYLKSGSRLLVFPEGSSSLGPRLLDIQPGVARMAMDGLRVRTDLKVVPVAVHYDRPWGFRSRAEVRMGDPVSLLGLSELPRKEGYRLAHERISDALHTLHREFADEREQEAFEVAENLRQLAKRDRCLEEESQIDGQQLQQAWSRLKSEAQDMHAARYNRLPLLTHRSLVRPALKVLTLAPFVLFMVLANLPIIFLSRLAAKRLADDRNVISIYRVLVGFPVMILWGGATLAAFLWAGWGALWIWSLALSLIGLGAYDSFMHALTLVRNAPLKRRLGRAFAEFVVASGLKPELV